MPSQRGVVQISDNVAITAGSGTTIATDDVSGVQYQRVKIAMGADGAADADVDSGQQLMAASLPVALASDQSDVKITLDGEAVVLGAGSAAIGKLAANSGVDIGDVDITSVVPGVAATSLGKAEDAAHSSGDTGVMALAVRTDTPAAASGASGDYEPMHTNKLGSVWMQVQGAAPYRNVDVDESEDAVSANPCVVQGFYCYNNAAAGTKRYLKFYNAGTGDVTVGTTTPVFVVELDGTQGISWNTPLLFSTACTIAATTGVADNDTGAPSANDVVFSCGYLDL
jgi:hypothetical protein